MKKEFALEKINKSRMCLFGIAALWIAIFHTYRVDFMPLFPNAVGNFLNFLREHGDIGVDIFLLLSGIGLYQSKKHNAVWRFYKNRIKRIFPTLILTLPVLAAFFFQGTLKSFFYNITSLTYWTRIWDQETPKGLFLWYISLLLLLYLIFPVLYRIIENVRWGGLYLLAFSILLNAIFLIFLPSIYKSVEYAMARLPIFITGAWLGKGILQHRTLKRAGCWCILFAAGVIGALGLLWLDDHIVHQLALQRTAYGIFALSFVLLWSFAAHHMHIRIIRGILEFIGKVSLQCYILFETLYKQLRPAILYQDETYLVSFLAIFCLTLFLSWLIEIVTGKMVQCFSRG